MVYQTKDKESIDAICFQFYRLTTSGQVEAVYEANRNLAEWGPLLPSNRSIVLPEIAPKDTQMLRLFGEV